MGNISWAGMKEQPISVEPGFKVSLDILKDGSLSLTLVSITGATNKTFTIPKPENGLRIEARVGSVETVYCNNTLVCVGSVGIADADNCIDIEGTVTSASAGNRVHREPRLTVEWGKRYHERNFPNTKMYKYKTPLVLRIEAAYLTALNVSVSGLSCETIVIGETKQAKCGNCMYIRGRVATARAGNSIAATQKLPPRSRMCLGRK